MDRVGRFFACALAVAFIGSIVPPVNAQVGLQIPTKPEDITVAQDMSQEIPAEGGRLLVSDASSLDARGAVLLPKVS